jgi:phenylacetate-CoA ligase
LLARAGRLSSVMLAVGVEWLRHLPAPVRRGLYFSLQRAVGSRIGPTWREFLSWERLSAAALAERVEERLSATLAGALAHNAAYRELGVIRRSGETAVDLLRRFPVLTRERLRDRFLDLVHDDWRSEITSTSSVAHRRYSWLVVKTGGTTGVPTTVVHDARGRDWGRATRLYAARQCGLPLGTRYFRLWGSEADLMQARSSPTQRAQQALLGYVPMNAFRAREEDLRSHYETLRRHPHIRHLETYVDAAVSLAQFIGERQLAPPRLKAIIACAGTVTAEARRLLESTFGAEVFDKYGSRECCDLACECGVHRGLHIYSPNVFLEVVDEEEVACAPGVTGRILVTLLNNPTFPLIRYDIGDLAQMAEPAACACGLAWPRLQSLQGRPDDMLMTEDGTRLTSVFVRHFVGVSLNRQIIRQWQVEQTTPRKCIFRYVPATVDGLEGNLREIRNSFEKALGRGVAFEPERVTEIRPSATGKHRWIINSCVGSGGA